MDIRDMHYNFMLKWEKVGTNQGRDFIIPEIDTFLNEALVTYISKIAEPFYSSIHGFELSQRHIDSISPIVRSTSLPILNYEVQLPDDYFYFVSGRISADKDGCTRDDLILRIRQHDDEFDKDEFNKSSFEWGEVNGIFEDTKIKFPDAQGMQLKSLSLTYISKPKYMHAAGEFPEGYYVTPGGIRLEGFEHCPFNDNVCLEIVDLAVYIASSGLKNTVDRNMKGSQLQYKQIT